MTNRNKQAALAWWRSLSTTQHIQLISWYWPSSPAVGIVRCSSKIERMWQQEGNPKPLNIKRTNDEYE
tara:strand:- start:556 stop:759 length:204 start_codon:yes stop_codon:yes gene_type:complete